MTTTELEPQFAVTVRGYDRAHVDEYVDTLREWLANATQRMETAERECTRLREEGMHLRGRMADQDRALREGPPRTIEALGDRLSAILLLAEEGASTVRADADAEAVAIIGRARQQAADAVAAAESRRTEMQAFIAGAADRAAEIVREGEARSMETAARLISEAEARASTREAEAEARATAREQDAEATASACEQEAQARATSCIREAEGRAGAREREAEAKATAREREAEARASTREAEAEKRAGVREGQAEARATARESEARQMSRKIMADAEAQRDRILTGLREEEAVLRDELARLAGERDEVVHALTRLREALHRTIVGLPDAPPPALPAEPSRVRLPVGVGVPRPAG